MDEYFKTKQSRCKFAHCSFDGITVESIKYDCIRNGMNDDQVIKHVAEEQCESCEHFKSKFIEYPITVTAIDVKEDNYSLRASDIGKPVRVRPCAEECEGKTYLGIFLGDLPASPLVSHNPETGVLYIKPLMNPAIFVPDLKKIIYGCESWWSIIEDPDELKAITDSDIHNQWYVKALKEMIGGKSDDDA